MRAALDPFSFLVVSIAGWMNQHQQHVIEYPSRKIGFLENRTVIGA
jgi:hypothetical protein